MTACRTVFRQSASSSDASGPRSPRFFVSTNTSHALTNAFGVLGSPMPMTNSPCSRTRVASRVKSLSLETMQNSSNLPECSGPSRR